MKQLEANQGEKLPTPHGSVNVLRLCMHRHTHTYVPPKAATEGISEAKKEVTLGIELIFAYKPMTHVDCLQFA